MVIARAFPLIASAMVGALTASSALAGPRPEVTTDQTRYLTDVYRQTTAKLDTLIGGSQRFDDDSVEVAFNVDPQGNVKAEMLLASSGDPTFDALVLRAVREAAPYPRAPAGSPSGLVWAHKKDVSPTTMCAKPCPIFLPGAGVGIVPPRGMAASQTFAGFEKNAARIWFVEEPRPANIREIERLNYSAVVHLKHKKTQEITIGDLQGTLTTGDNIEQPFHQWQLVLLGPKRYCIVYARIPREASEITPADMEAALRSLTLRDIPSLPARVAALPFKIGDLGGMHATATAFGNMLTLEAPPTNDVYDPPTQLTIQVVIDPQPSTKSLLDRARALLLSFHEDPGEDGNPKTITFVTADASFVGFDFETAAAYARFGGGRVILGYGRKRPSDPESSAVAFQKVISSLRLK